MRLYITFVPSRRKADLPAPARSSRFSRLQSPSTPLGRHSPTSIPLQWITGNRALGSYSLGEVHFPSAAMGLRESSPSRYTPACAREAYAASGVSRGGAEPERPHSWTGSLLTP